MYVRVRGDEVLDVELRIFEPPRFFEAFLRGRALRRGARHHRADLRHLPGRLPDERLRRRWRTRSGSRSSGQLRDLRRLIYCGEWIESHALHVYMLHAPDFLGYESGFAMARDHREVVERGLRAEEGGQRADRDRRRARGAPDQRPRRRLLPGAGAARAGAAAGRARARPRGGAGDRALGRRPRLPRARARLRARLAALPARGRVPDRPRADRLLEGDRHRAGGVRRDVRGGAGRRTPTRCTRACAAAAPTWPGRWRASTSTATGSRRSPPRRRGRPASATGCRNPFRSIVVRAVEILYAFDEALRLIDAYEPPDAPAVEVEPRAAVGHGVTEAPRGLLYHRYEIDDDGEIASARIVPPTSQNQRSIEEDLREFVAAQRRPARRGAAPPLRADDPQLRPLHLLLDPLPAARGRARVSGERRLFIGIGNPLRGDDAAGLLAARALRERGAGGAEVRELEGEPVDLIDAWAGRRAGPRRRRRRLRRRARGGAPDRRRRRAAAGRPRRPLDPRARARRGDRAGTGAGAAAAAAGRLRDRGRAASSPARSASAAVLAAAERVAAAAARGAARRLRHRSDRHRATLGEKVKAS